MCLLPGVFFFLLRHIPPLLSAHRVMSHSLTSQRGSPLRASWADSLIKRLQHRHHNMVFFLLPRTLPDSHSLPSLSLYHADPIPV